MQPNPYLPPPPPPPPSPLPPRKPSLWQWYCAQSRIVRIVIAVIVIAFVGSAAINGVIQGVQQSLAPAPTSIATSVPTQPSQATTQASQPTSAPTAKPTTKPKPTATQTVAQRIQQIVQDKAFLASKVETKVNHPGEVIVTVTLLDNTNDGLRTSIQSNCFDMEQAIWQSSIKPMKDVEINFLGNLVDKYGNPSVGALGLCELLAGTEAKFNWANLNPIDAWNDYDAASFSSAIQS